MFFQWVLCIGIWLVGLIVNLIRYQPPLIFICLYFWVVCYGPVVSSLGLLLMYESGYQGNIMVVPIIKMIGMTMGLTLWGVTNLLAGWMTGR